MEVFSKKKLTLLKDFTILILIPFLIRTFFQKNLVEMAKSVTVSSVWDFLIVIDQLRFFLDQGASPFTGSSLSRNKG